jgi:phosphatidylglycerophosphatase A
VDRLTRVLGSFFGLGLLPVAPGTWGTLGAMGLAMLLPDGNPIWPMCTAAVFLLACGLCIVLGDYAERMEGKKDPGFIVLDEVAGYFVICASFQKPSAAWLVVGFFLFRVFDVWKPWPGRRLERHPGGRGILYDDLMMGLYTFLVLIVLRQTGVLALLPLGRA